MLRKLVMGLALAAIAALLVPEAAFARSGFGGHGFHGGGFHGGGFRGGGFAGRSLAVAPRAYSGARFYSGAGRGYAGNVARWNGGTLSNAYRWRGYGYYRPYRRYPYYAAAAVGAAAIGAYGAYYGGYPYYYDDECYQVVTVYGPYGPEARRVYVCE
jgi:hypothetical protein